MLDSGVGPGAGCCNIAGERRFIDEGGSVRSVPSVSDPLGHGTAVAASICSASPAAELLIGQVLDGRGVTTPAALAAAIRWAVEAGAGLIHMSLGLREDREVLASSIASATAAHRVVVASAPARGDRIFPASYPGVIRATGDARCQPGEISALDSLQADFGGCPRQSLSEQRAGGASLGAAHVTGFIAAHVTPDSPAFEVRNRLTALARYHGIERRQADRRGSESHAEVGQ